MIKAKESTMLEKKKENCAHGSLKFEDEAVEGVGVPVPVIRCKDYGEAIAVFLQDEGFGKLSDQLDIIHKGIKKLLK
jgi:hypothetical protein